VLAAALCARATGILVTVRRAKGRARDAAEAVSAAGEQVVDVGIAWATRMRDGVALLFLARRQYLIALTNRRLLVFDRRGSGPRGRVGPADLVLGKRYEFFALERTRRRRILLQVVLRGENDTRLVLEFRPSQRALGRALAARLTSPVAVGVGAVAAQPPTAGSRTTPSPEEAERTAAEAFWGSR
jgi:hypothetical protein